MASKRELLAATNLSESSEVFGSPPNIIDDIMEGIPLPKEDHPLVKKGVYMKKYQSDIIDYVSYVNSVKKTATLVAIIDAGIDALYPELKERVMHEGRIQDYGEAPPPHLSKYE